MIKALRKLEKVQKEKSKSFVADFPDEDDGGAAYFEDDADLENYMCTWRREISTRSLKNQIYMKRWPPTKKFDERFEISAMLEVGNHLRKAVEKEDLGRRTSTLGRAPEFT